MTDSPKAPRGDGPALSERVDQIGAIIVRSLDLAEAGISLGLTVLTRAGAATQASLLDRLPGDDAGDRGDATGAHRPPASSPPPPPEDAFYLTNRLPLSPGGTAKVSFSISNDAVTAPKRVTVRVEGFVGEAEGTLLDAASFAVRPATKTIAPMDFEKFVLTATVPPETPPDIYRGAVAVASTDETRILVRLVVAPP